jgi:hypothetical protein
MLDRMNSNEAIFNRIMNDGAFKAFITRYLMQNVFAEFKRQVE